DPVTYLLPGYNQFTVMAETPCRRYILRIPFRGGDKNKGRPAEFTTARPIVIRTIERSPAYRQGRILRK
ncbi:MAG: hypothetical protein K2L89_03445, partial [Muribaculaceae bacterium]|nr:hypothetical protein [Muribaculaceae bacterium]